MRRCRALLVVPAASCLLALGLGGCAAAVVVPPAPSAAAVGCAAVARALPARVAGLQVRTTTAQSAAAWGPAGAPEGGSGEVVLRCGVEPPGPTTTACTAVAPKGLPEVDWITEQDKKEARFTTYGRVPAVQLVVPTTLTQADPTLPQDILADVATAVATVPAQRRCE